MCLVVSALALAAPVSAAAQLVKYDALFVFSDSFGDTGNDWILTKSLGLTPAIPPSESPHKTYFRGRFSNGPIMFEHFWSNLNPNGGPVVPSLSVSAIPRKGAISFAYGGSKSGNDCFPFAGLQCQVEQFAELLGGAPPPSRALFAVFSGANDVLGADLSDPSMVEGVVKGIVSNVAQAIERLYALGARDVMVLNMPNLGVAPIVPVALKVPADGVAQYHNALLSAALSQLSSNLPGLRIIPIDVYGYLNSLIANQSFTNFNEPALPMPAATCLFDGAMPAGINCPDVATFNVDRGFFFWDIEHPSKAAHSAIGGFLHREVTKLIR
jgi:phospholipase/lecithinase/hemolysin